MTNEISVSSRIHDYIQDYYERYGYKPKYAIMNESKYIQLKYECASMHNGLVIPIPGNEMTHIMGLQIIITKSDIFDVSTDTGKIL